MTGRSVNGNDRNNERRTMSKRKLTGSSRGRKERSETSCATCCVPQASTNTKGNGENAVATDADTSEDPKIAVWEFMLKLARQKKTSEEDVGKLRQQIVSSPATWKMAGDSMASIRNTLVEKMSAGVLRAIMLAEADILAKQLDYDAAPPLERLLIDQVLTARLRLIHAEKCFNNNLVAADNTIAQAEYWNGFLSTAQARFLRAIESLARIRRLARITPALQINIANEGGKQVNVQT